MLKKLKQNPEKSMSKTQEKSLLFNSHFCWILIFESEEYSSYSSFMKNKISIPFLSF